MLDIYMLILSLKVLLSCNLPLHFLVTCNTSIPVRNGCAETSNCQCLVLPQVLEQRWEMRVSWLVLPVGL